LTDAVGCGAGGGGGEEGGAGEEGGGEVHFSVTESDLVGDVFWFSKWGWVAGGLFVFGGELVWLGVWGLRWCGRVGSEWCRYGRFL